MTPEDDPIVAIPVSALDHSPAADESYSVSAIPGHKGAAEVMIPRFVLNDAGAEAFPFAMTCKVKLPGPNPAGRIKYAESG